MSSTALHNVRRQSFVRWREGDKQQLGEQRYPKHCSERKLVGKVSSDVVEAMISGTETCFKLQDRDRHTVKKVEAET